MFIENVVRNRGAVVAPWREYRREGNSVFWFHILFGLATLVVFLLVAAVAVLIALGDMRAGTFGAGAVAGIVVGVVGLLVVGIVSAVVGLFLNDFVVPIMYLRRIGVLAAWREFYSSMLVGHSGTFVLYVLVKIVMAIVLNILSGLLTLCTCCIGLIPYLGSHVLMLPLYVFRRSYSLHFLEQFGSEWRFFAPAVEFPAERFEEHDEWGDERFRPGDEGIRRPRDDRIQPPDEPEQP